MEIVASSSSDQALPNDREREELLRRSKEQIHEIFVKLPLDVTDEEKVNLGADFQVHPTYLVFETWFTDRLLIPSRLEKLRTLGVAAVDGVLIDVPAEDASFFEGKKSKNQVIFHASACDKHSAEDLLFKLVRITVETAIVKDTRFVNGKLVKYYIYDCESG